MVRITRLFLEKVKSDTRDHLFRVKLGHKKILLYCHKIVRTRLFVQDYNRFDPRNLYYIAKNLASHLMEESKDQTRFTNKNDPVARIKDNR